MAIKIQTQQTYIPIQLGDLELKFHVTDDSVLSIQREIQNVQKELDNLNGGKNEKETLEQAKLALKRGFDTFFGQDTFEKIYDISPSVMIVMSYFEQISDAVLRELGKMGYGQSQTDKAKKYLANKKK